MDDSFNYPLSLLEARLKALAAEAGNFTTVSGRLLDILANETSLVDDILAADELARWEATLPQLDGAWSTGWSFRIGQGRKSFTLPPIDPVNQVEYDADLRLGQIFNCTRSPPGRAQHIPRARAGRSQSGFLQHGGGDFLTHKLSIQRPGS